MILYTVVCTLIFVVSILLAWYLGAYMYKVYQGNKSWMDFLKSFEKFIFRICGIDPTKEMNWKEYLLAVMVITVVWLVFSIIILMNQGSLWMNPAHNPSMDWSLALHSAVSYLTSTNLQHYAGESGATYLSQITVFMLLQFMSAATSLAVGVAVVRGLASHTSTSIGNFYNDFVLSLTRILLPLSLTAAILFLVCGVPMTICEPYQITTLQGDTVSIATGPVAAFLPIKELGSNGGGFFGTNNAHPFENPNFFYFVIHSVIVFLLPMAFVFFVGHCVQSKKFALMIFTVMTVGFAAVTVPIIYQEVSGNPSITTMGISNSGNMEGKEVRYGAFYSAFYAGQNSAIPAGTVVGMNDSFMPISSLCMLIGMSIDAFYGGLGSGWINMFFYVILSLFIASLMIGRTADIFGKKIGIRELQITMSVLVLQGLLPLVLTSIACVTIMNYSGGNERLTWLSNPGPHGFTTMLYEYISSIAGNGSGFEGLKDNTVFWNLMTALAMLTGRFVPIIGSVWIAGLLIQKTYIPPTIATLRIDNFTFGLFLFAIIIVSTVLSLFPALVLGPLFENTLLR